MSIDYAERARALVGARFRPQGRGVEGLDCVGVILATFDIGAQAAPKNYRLDCGDHAELTDALLTHFRRVPRRELAPGDVIVVRIGERQLHLGVRTAAGFVHAHAGMRRVVETPGVPEWPIAGIYRRRVRARSR
jgi:hypothetical protein